MKPAWYIPPVNDDCRRLREAAHKQGMHVLDPSESWCRDRPVLCYGSIATIQALQQQCSRFMEYVDWCDWRKLRCSHYYAFWGKHLVNQYYGMYPLGEVRRLRQRLCAWYYSEPFGTIFVRPDANDKVFPGGVVRHGDLGAWLAQADVDVLEDTLLCVVARAEKITTEYRLWLADGKLVTASRYLHHDKVDHRRGCPVPVLDFAEEVASKWSPHRLFCLDVAVLANSTLGVLECGSVHTCGLYAADEEAIVEAMGRIAQEEYRELCSL
jgi:hypothetical protein